MENTFEEINMGNEVQKSPTATRMLAAILIFFIFGPGVIECRSNLLLSAPDMCPIDDGNLIGILLFIEDSNACFEACERKEDCKYFRCLLFY